MELFRTKNFEYRIDSEQKIYDLNACAYRQSGVGGGQVTHPNVDFDTLKLNSATSAYNENHDDFQY